MEGRQRRSFTDDYKRQAVDLVMISLPTSRASTIGRKTLRDDAALKDRLLVSR
jgi:hypothetical protein